jgi:hypothetical protein
MPASRISAKVIFWRVACGIAHNRADRAGAKPLEVGPSPPGHASYAERSGKHRRARFFKFDVDVVITGRVLNALNKRAETH